jgi:hypothetical protein
MFHVQPALSARFRVQPSPDPVSAHNRTRSTFLYLHLSISFYPRSILALNWLVGLRRCGPTSLSFFFPRPSSAFQASTKRTCSASLGSALGPWLKLFRPPTELHGLAPTCTPRTLPASPRTVFPCSLNPLCPYKFCSRNPRLASFLLAFFLLRIFPTSPTCMPHPSASYHPSAC